MSEVRREERDWTCQMECVSGASVRLSHTGKMAGSKQKVTSAGKQVDCFNTQGNTHVLTS